MSNLDKQNVKEVEKYSQPISMEIVAETLRQIRENEPTPYKPIKFLGKWPIDKHMKQLDHLINSMK